MSRVRSRARWWCFTIGRGEAEWEALKLAVLQGFHTLNYEYVVMQGEEGEEAGYQHLQGTVYFKKQCDFSKLRTTFSDLPDATSCLVPHWEVTRSPQSSIEYCKKPEGRVWGPYEDGSSWDDYLANDWDVTLLRLAGQPTYARAEQL